jgi:tripartite-type tricarboxylate transporter receptor subunit TctC
MKRILAAVLAAAFAAPMAWAQSFPTKPIRLVVPYPAGGTTDIMARALQVPIQKALGQPLVIENKPGAGGVLAAREVAKAAPDGYTLFFVNSGIVAVTPQVVKNPGFDGVKDFAPVALVSTAPLFVVTNAAVPATDIRGFIDYAKKQNEPVTYASAGIGSFGHLASELFAKSAGVKMTHIPYKGQAPTTNAVISGEVKMLITTASANMNEFIANGKLKLLGVTSAEPSPVAPGAAAVGATLPGYKAETWFAMLAPAGTPPEVVNRLNGVINDAVQTADMKQRFTSFGLVAATATPQKLGAMIAEEVARWSPIIRENAITAE